VVLGSKVPRGEELLIKSYLLDDSSGDSSASTDPHNLQGPAAQQPAPKVAPPTSTDRPAIAALSQQPPIETSTPSVSGGSEVPPPIIRPVTPLSYRPQSSARAPKTSKPGELVVDTDVCVCVCVCVLEVIVHFSPFIHR